jgi:hypothetical protein
MQKPSPRALCITSNPGLRRALRRSLQAVGSSVEFSDGAPNGSAGSADAPHDLVVIDGDVRRDRAVRDFALSGDRDVICLGESLEDDEVVALVRNSPLDHVISDAASLDDDELLVTSVKLLSGDIFGLEKYLSWGAKVHDIAVDSYEQKRTSLLTVAQHAREVGARRQVIAKIESVTDELLMNAMYDAPAVSRGEPPRMPTPGTRPAKPPGRGLLRYGCDGRYFAVSVEDQFGGLQKEAILDHLIRARAERGRPRSGTPSGGAGLGLYFVLSSVTRFIANIEPGVRTEVVCLFDLRQSGREADACTRSLHIFRAAPTRRDDDDDDDSPQA